MHSGLVSNCWLRCILSPSIAFQGLTLYPSTNENVPSLEWHVSKGAEFFNRQCTLPFSFFLWPTCSSEGAQVCSCLQTSLTLFPKDPIRHLFHVTETVYQQIFLFLICSQLYKDKINKPLDFIIEEQNNAWILASSPQQFKNSFLMKYDVCTYSTGIYYHVVLLLNN